ncbi:hypothetical protein WT56_09705 [Burkholderia pseudomultivorans]|uniref:Uncharacterized protein n=1 Tax=Burkholderia pseudomultivorans TaxID=1207504 RepID=A0A132EL62_9BURK|nr:hypothetical protein WT56_09705 [Burkholderia pseudomultivorans]
MGCMTRFPDVVRASVPRRLPEVRPASRRIELHGAWRRAPGTRDASRGAFACRTGWPDVSSDDDPRSERES